MGRYLLAPRIPDSKITRFKRSGGKGITQVTAHDLTLIADPNSRRTIEVGARFRTTFYRIWVVVGVEPHEIVAVSERSGQLAMLSPEAAAERFTEKRRIRPCSENSYSSPDSLRARKGGSEKRKRSGAGTES